MSKIVCEICGSTYPSTHAACPICGWTHNTAAAAPEEEAAPIQEELDLDGLREEYLEDPNVVTAVQSAPKQEPKKSRAIFDYDADQKQMRRERAAAAVEDDEYTDAEEDSGEEEESSPSTLLVILLVVLIVLLLVATGFVFFKFFLPSRADKPEETLPPVTAEIVETVATEPELPTIPCESLALPNGIEVLRSQGQNYLLNVIYLPTDTTDGLTYRSEDESIAVVNEEGRVTAVSEGETFIVVTCGNQSITCPVKVAYEEETEPTETEGLSVAVSDGAPVETTEADGEAGEEEDEAEDENAEATEETKKIAEGEIVLKLKKDDIQFGRFGVYTTLELDCDLKPEDVSWESNNKYVADVDATGRVTALGPGLANVTVTYGDQKVVCIVRCRF